MIHIPDLPHHCNSWIVIEKATGKAVCETWNREYLKCFDSDKVEIKTAADHLASLNKAP
ncbi:hypothetical protein D3C81_1720140 [compost metagenome]